jgi:hypothetical protein
MEGGTSVRCSYVRMNLVRVAEGHSESRTESGGGIESARLVFVVIYPANEEPKHNPTQSGRFAPIQQSTRSEPAT